MLLYSFDPHRYTKNSRDLCDILEKEDKLKMGDLADNFLKQIMDEEKKFYDHIVAIQSPSGNGKSFFLALLYCKILKKEIDNPVNYINILDYISDDNAQNCIDIIEDKRDRKSKTSVVLIDNLDKHSPKFIYEFIHLLHKLTSKENFLFIVAYDYDLLLTKLSKYLAGGEQEIERYLQSHIHLDYLLGMQDLEINSIISLPFVPVENVQKTIVDIIKSGYATGAFSVKQIVIIIAKLEIYIAKNKPESIKEVYLAFKLIAIKLLCKKIYVSLFAGKGLDYDNCADEKAKKHIIEIDEIVSKNTGTSNNGIEGDSEISENTVIKKMEIS